MSYILVDLANVFYRSRYVVNGADLDSKIGLAFHITLTSVKKVWQDYKGSHVVFCTEGRSWRKDVYKPYKANRKEDREKLSDIEKDEEEVFWEAMNSFTNFLTNKTNCTVLHHNQAEADDLIARWIALHPNDKNIIVSTDTDLHQLINENVCQYDGVKEHLITQEGYFDNKNQPVIDAKTNAIKVPLDPEYFLFEKCIRGDSTDNVFSAYPKVRKTKIKEAYEDRQKKGFAWNNLMLGKWVDHNSVEHHVKNDYERNRVLIDLSAQPADIKKSIDDSILEAISTPKLTKQVGTNLMRFCAQWNLQRISDNAQGYATFLNARYKA